MSGVGQDSVPDHVIEVLDVAGGPTDCRLHEPSQVYYREIQRAMPSHFRHASAKRTLMLDETLRTTDRRRRGETGRLIAYLHFPGATMMLRNDTRP